MGRIYPVCDELSRMQPLARKCLKIGELFSAVSKKPKHIFWGKFDVSTS